MNIKCAIFIQLNTSGQGDNDSERDVCISRDESRSMPRAHGTQEFHSPLVQTGKERPGTLEQQIGETSKLYEIL